MTDAVVARALAKRYGSATALAGIDWSVPAGSVTALVGPNGAGKTTTVKLLLGLTAPSSGDIRVLGHNPRAAAMSTRRRIGFVPEDKTDVRIVNLRRISAGAEPIHQ